jgi:hypothetical protein
VRHFLRYAPAVAVLASLAAAASARADIIATFDNDTAGPQQVKAVNATTGARVQVAAGVDDPQASEFHLSRSPDGRYLVFERRLAGTVRIVMLESATGRTAELFSGFEAAQDPPNTPTFSRDGTKVLTGRRLERRDDSAPPGTLQASFTETDVTSFPLGPFRIRSFRPAEPTRRRRAGHARLSLLELV